MSFRRSFLASTVMLIIIAGLIWLLNIEGIIKGTWSTPLSALFSILAVLFAFIQVLLLISPSKAKQINSSPFPSIPIEKARIPSAAPLLDAKFFPPSYEDYENFVQSIIGREAPGALYRKGALFIFTTSELKHMKVSVFNIQGWLQYPTGTGYSENIPPRPYLDVPVSAYIEEFFFNHKLLYAAYLKDMEPGTYIIWININKPASVVIKSEEITMIDWRAYSI